MIEIGFKQPDKTMKLSYDEELDKSVFLWFTQKREEGIPISGQIIQAKASVFSQQIQERIEYKVFSASAGWIWRFCRCHNIRELCLREKICQ